MNITREQEALKAYVKLLSSQGVSQRVLVQREFIIIRLATFLEKIPGEGSHYRHAVDRFIASIDPAEIPAVLPVIREFFSFWVKDIKAIAAMSQAKVFNGAAPAVMATQDELFKHWYDLDKTVLNHAEEQMLEAFHHVSLARGLDPLISKERMRMAKFLMLSLRRVPHKQSHSYRQMVDSNLPLFSALGTQHAFLSVSREFYYFWRGDMVMKTMTEERNRELAIAA